MEWFVNDKLTDHITRITEITGVFMYLVQGEERALLIDTGCGLGNLREYVQTLTKLPLTVVCTHGHLDHAGGAAQFDEVWLNPADWELTFSHCTVENRREYAEICCNPQDFKEEECMKNWEYLPVRKAAYRELADEMIFDLGGVSVQALLLRGHTQGCMCMLVREERRILFGDACNPSVFLFGEEASAVDEYRQSLVDFQKYEHLYDEVFLSHGDGKMLPKTLREECIKVCDEILEQSDEQEIFRFMGGEYRAAHAVSEKQIRKDGGKANIIYDSKQLGNNGVQEEQEQQQWNNAVM